jgi:phosphohistidine phosphatase SixA
VKKYFLMRHGDAGATLPDPAMDRARHLTDTGKAQVRSVAFQLDGLHKQPTAVIADSDSRCSETGMIMADALGLQCTYDSRLGSVDSARDAIADYTGGSAQPLLVTHDHVIGGLTGDPGLDWPQKAEVRRFKGTKEKRRLVP